MNFILLQEIFLGQHFAGINLLKMFLVAFFVLPTRV